MKTTKMDQQILITMFGTKNDHMMQENARDGNQS